MAAGKRLLMWWKVRAMKEKMMKSSGFLILSCTIGILMDLHSWKDVNLNWSLISALEENETINQVLFPMPGEKATLNVAGKPKTEQQYRLAKILFKDHEEYGAAFAKATTAMDKAVWMLKIKNQLTQYVQSMVNLQSMAYI